MAMAAPNKEMDTAAPQKEMSTKSDSKKGVDEVESKELELENEREPKFRRCSRDDELAKIGCNIATFKWQLQQLSRVRNDMESMWVEAEEESFLTSLITALEDEGPE